LNSGSAEFIAHIVIFVVAAAVNATVRFWGQRALIASQFAETSPAAVYAQLWIGHDHFKASSRPYRIVLITTLICVHQAILSR
jgi:mannose-6-phosphate isomerase class I